MLTVEISGKKDRAFGRSAKHFNTFLQKSSRNVFEMPDSICYFQKDGHRP